MSLQSERKTIPVPRGSREFVHVTLVGWPQERIAEGIPLDALLPMAYCRTPKFRLRCDCGMVDLWWEETNA